MDNITSSPEPTEISARALKSNPLNALQEAVEDLIYVGLLEAKLNHFDFVVSIKITHKSDL